VGRSFNLILLNWMIWGNLKRRRLRRRLRRDSIWSCYKVISWKF